MSRSLLENAYLFSKKTKPLFELENKQGAKPLTFEDSLSLVPYYPFCTLGVLTAEGKWGTQKGIAFVVQDNYLLTCASNCYSHQHGQYPNITFTINSNRKHGYDTYKIAKVFIPEQYKLVIKSKRKRFNYALLYIEGKFNLKDKYGCLRIAFQGIDQDKLTYFECFLNKQNQLQLTSQSKIGYNNTQILEGTPIFFEYKKSVHGLLTQNYLLIFDKNMQSCLYKWVEVQSGCMDVRIKSSNDLNSSTLIKVAKVNIIKKLSVSCYQQIQANFHPFYEHYSSSSLKTLQIHHNLKNIGFITMDKFQHLKHLSLYTTKLGPKGCRYIVESSLNNLRSLSIETDAIGDKGCEYLSTAKWPFLGRLLLAECWIGKDGVKNLCQAIWPNLQQLSLPVNKMLKEGIAQEFSKAYFPRNQLLNLSQNAIECSGLSFLNTPSWKSLSYLVLTGNPIANKGCKMISQAGLTLYHAFLDNCHIDSIGVKWLCKGNLKELRSLSLLKNKLDDRGCLYISKTKMPKLQLASLPMAKINMKGLKLLLENEWEDNTLHSMMYCGGYIPAEVYEDNDVHEEEANFFDIQSFLAGRFSSQKFYY